MTMPDKLHLGCGTTTPEGWLNVDSSWGARLAKRPTLRRVLSAFGLLPTSVRQARWSSDIFIHDLTKRLPFADNTFADVYTSHTLEHLYLEQAQALLKECLRVLQPGGVARMVVPDLNVFVREYMGQCTVYWPPEDFEPPTPADRLCRNLLMREWRPPQGSGVRKLHRALNDIHSHKWMYDAASLAYHMKQAGFVDVAEMQYRDSRIEEIQAIEMPERVLNSQGICVEGIKSETITA